MNARELNAMIAYAHSRGREVYAEKLVINTLGLVSQYSIPIIHAKTRNGAIMCKCKNGEYRRAHVQSTFDIR